MLEFAEALGAEEAVVVDEVVGGLVLALFALYFVELLLEELVGLEGVPE